MKRNIIALLAALAAAMLGACCKDCGQKYKLAVMADILGQGYGTKLEAFDMAKEIGVQGVQLGKNYREGETVYFTPQQIAAFKAKSAATGIEVSSLVVPNLPMHDKQKCVAYAKTVIDAAKALGARTILVPFFGDVAKLTEKDDNKKVVEAKFMRAAENLKEIMPYAEKAGVLICLEDTLSSEDNLRMIKTVGSPNLKVYFDTFNIVYYGHEEISSIEKLKGQIGEIHLKDKGHKLGSSREMPKDFEACAAAVKRIGYTGWLCFETHAFDYKKDNIIDTLKYNVEYVKKHFK